MKVRPGMEKGERWPVRAGWAIPHRTEFFNLNYPGGGREPGETKGD